MHNSLLFYQTYCCVLCYEILDARQPTFSTRVVCLIISTSEISRALIQPLHLFLVLGNLRFWIKVNTPAPRLLCFVQLFFKFIHHYKNLQIKMKLKFRFHSLTCDLKYFRLAHSCITKSKIRLPHAKVVDSILKYHVHCRTLFYKNQYILYFEIAFAWK